MDKISNCSNIIAKLNNLDPYCSQVHFVELYNMMFMWVFFPDDPDYNPKEAKKMEATLKKMEKQDEKNEKRTLKGTARAVTLANKLSPKAQRKKDKAKNTTSQLKVRNLNKMTFLPNYKY
jgi:phytoene dehydrogenase-like protein